MENKHIIAALGVGLAILLLVLFLFHSSKTPDVGVDNPLNLSSQSQQAAPTPITITQLQVQDIAVGTGSAVVAAGDTITVNYIGAMTDGKVFDSSYQAKKPFTLTVGTGSVIPGFDQGVVGMKLGGKRRILIPSNLGYGDKVQGPIPANSSLIFEVELINIQPPVTPTPTPAPSPEVSPTAAPTPTPNP